MQSLSAHIGRQHGGDGGLVGDGGLELVEDDAHGVVLGLQKLLRNGGHLQGVWVYKFIKKTLTSSSATADTCI